MQSAGDIDTVGQAARTRGVAALGGQSRALAGDGLQELFGAGLVGVRVAPGKKPGVKGHDQFAVTWCTAGVTVQRERFAASRAREG